MEPVDSLLRFQCPVSEADEAWALQVSFSPRRLSGQRMALWGLALSLGEALHPSVGADTRFSVEAVWGGFWQAVCKLASFFCS